VTESTPTADAAENPRIERLIKAEQSSLEAGGCCLRLAGLYNLQRGPHNFWLTSGKEIQGIESGIVNLLHYDDAASACLAALKAGPSVCSKKAFLVSDGHPMTRKEICESSLKAKVYQSYSMPSFAADQPQARGKIYDGSITNKMLQWSPKYESFDAFMEANA